jgi:hypothetical protein
MLLEYTVFSIGPCENLPESAKSSQFRASPYPASRCLTRPLWRRQTCPPSINAKPLWLRGVDAIQG